MARLTFLIPYSGTVLHRKADGGICHSERAAGTDRDSTSGTGGELIGHGKRAAVNGNTLSTLSIKLTNRVGAGISRIKFQRRTARTSPIRIEGNLLSSIITIPLNRQGSRKNRRSRFKTQLDIAREFLITQGHEAAVKRHRAGEQQLISRSRISGRRINVGVEFRQIERTLNGRSSDAIRLGDLGSELAALGNGELCSATGRSSIRTDVDPASVGEIAIHTDIATNNGAGVGSRALNRQSAACVQRIGICQVSDRGRTVQRDSAGIGERADLSNLTDDSFNRTILGYGHRAGLQ